MFIGYTFNYSSEIFLMLNLAMHGTYSRGIIRFKKLCEGWFLKKPKINECMGNEDNELKIKPGTHTDSIDCE
jgi:hypothetical protein